MDVYEGISTDGFQRSALGGFDAFAGLRDCGGGGQMVMGLGGPPEPPLQWCHGCGDWVERLGDDQLCVLCEEVDARMDAHIGSAMEDYAERAISVALDYLHPDDVLGVVARAVEDRGTGGGDLPRLRDRYERSHRFIDARAQGARDRQAERDAAAADTPPGEAAGE